ncbi:ArsR/SmtB family transcription factor [Herbidospora mongoliensis]|uniref:ArsR/SmtB family transcription factor n=1 Tax=Herbidospora mongoliensis TaxID=688067 RepID=UPI000A01A058|nr:metalloregulator ArsR/SmtB family transcription factor [Herbidospora mongoliensis]
MEENADQLSRAEAEEYATWFKVLSDPTRLQIVSLLARRHGPMTVNEVVAASGVGQPTVSHHLRLLSEVRFVVVEPQGTTRLYRINERWLNCFPMAADIVMGNRPAPDTSGCS